MGDEEGRGGGGWVRGGSQQRLAIGAGFCDVFANSPPPSGGKVKLEDVLPLTPHTLFPSR